MTFQKFLSKEKISLPAESLQLCQQGLRHLAEVADHFHGLKHVESILTKLSQLLQQETFPRKIRFDILLPAIVWHDCWKAGRRSQFPLTLLFDQLWDGHGSYWLFRSATKHSRVPLRIRQIISHTIRDHSWLALEDHASLEYKILHDLDGLEEWRSAGVTTLMVAGDREAARTMAELVL